MKDQYCKHRFFKTFFLPCTAFLLMITLCATAPLAAVTGSITFQSNLGGSARYALQSENLLYTLMGSKLYIANIADIKNPVEIGSLPIPGIGRRLEKKGSLLYIACTEGGLATVDVSDPAKPKLLDSLQFDTAQKAGEVFDVTLYGDYAYVADYRTGLYIVDIKDPANLAVKASFTDFENQDDPYPYDLFISGTYLYLSCEHDGLYIFDITNPLQISVQSHFRGPESVGNQFFQSYREGNILYIAGGVAGLVIVDVTDIKNPVYISNIDKQYGGVLSIAKVGNFVYLCTEFTDFYKIDVSDFQNLKQVESFPLDGHHSLGLSMAGNYVFLANSNYGIRIFDVSGQSMTQAGAYTSLGRVIDCQGAGQYAYVAAGKNGVQIFNVSNPQKPALLSKTTVAGYANGLFVGDGKVYVAELLAEGESSGGFLEILDTSNPSSPSVLGKIDLEGEPFDVIVAENRAYVACQSKGIAVVDVSNPSAPVLLSSFDTHGVSYQAALLWGRFLAVADGIQAFTLLDALDPSFIQRVAGGYDIGNVQDCALWDTSLFLPAGVNGVFLSDIALPFAPTDPPVQVISAETSRGLNGAIKVVTVFDSYLLAADTAAGLRLFDIADPGQPAELDIEPYMVGDPIKITSDQQQGLAYVSSQIAGLYIYQVAVTSGPGIDLDGRWIGSIVSSTGTAGIAAEIDQSHSDVSGTAALFMPFATSGTFDGTIENNGLAGTITYEGKTASYTLTYNSSTKSLTGNLTGDIQGTLEMNYAGMRGDMNMNAVLTSLNNTVTDQMAQASGFNKMMLSITNNLLNNALSQPTMSSTLSTASFAELLLGLMQPDGVTAAANYFVYPAAEWNASVAQAKAISEVDDICADQKEKLAKALDSGNRLFEQGIDQGEQGKQARAIRILGRAVHDYESVADLYQQLKPSCPEFGIAQFDGYYTGTIDFGFISAALRMCVDEADNGSVTGEAYIAIEATGEFMKGILVDGKNSSDAGYSIVTGTIEVKVGDITAHIVITGFTYNPSSGQWEGQVEVQEQKVTGNVTLKFTSADCPPGWNEKAK